MAAQELLMLRNLLRKEVDRMIDCSMIGLIVLSVSWRLIRFPGITASDAKQRLLSMATRDVVSFTSGSPNLLLHTHEPSVNIRPTQLVLTEGGPAANVTVVLYTQPTHNVTVRAATSLQPNNHTAHLAQTCC